MLLENHLDFAVQSLQKHSVKSYKSEFQLMILQRVSSVLAEEGIKVNIFFLPENVGLPKE